MVISDVPDWQPGPAPIACLVHPESAAQLHEDLRAAAARHDDMAWVHTQPLTTKDGYAVLTRDLLDAAGVVGTRTPRSVGERHMIRVGTHWIHGPVRHVIVSEAQWVPPSVWAEVQDMALIAGTRLWLLIDASTPTDHARWITGSCQVQTPDWITNAWLARPPATGLCPVRPWSPGSDPTWPDPSCRVHENRVQCLLSAGRRRMSTGEASADSVRAYLISLLQSDTATVDDWWAATAAGRDFYRPAEDALIQLGAHTITTRLCDVASDGSSVHLPIGTREVPLQMRPALARQRTSRMLSGCHPTERLLGVFDESPG